jgi:Insertion element 4 transposase N-terminal
MAPAAPAQLPWPPPITDRIALGALTSAFPPELVDRVVEQTGRAEQRRRLLPARVVVYFVLALALYGHAAYEEVLRCLVEGLGWAQQARRGRRSWPYWHVPGASALAEARTRLGAEPLKLLFAQAAQPLATRATRGAWYRHWRLVILDGTGLDVPDTSENAAAFGRPGSGRGEGWAPSRRCGWWGWWRRARTRSWMPPRGPTGPVSRRWHASLPAIMADLGLGCCCWPTGCLWRGAVAGHGRHRRGPAVAGQVRQHHRPQAAG